jgi:hypothetical protein
MSVYAKPKHYAFEVYSCIHYKGTPLNELPHQVELGSTAVPVAWIEWCRDNATDKWGWWFDQDSVASIGFASSSDLVMFKLLCSTVQRT